MICVTRLNGVFLIGLKSYPRRCGENQHRVRLWRRKYGSSPQVRGKLDAWNAGEIPVRLIPAGAGKTGANPPCRLKSSAHPRRCGENVFFTPEPTMCAGSSPQVRGKLLSSVLMSWTMRLIPAGAGKTSTANAAVPGDTAHPRRCGENSMAA